MRGLIKNLAKTNIINPKTKKDDLYVLLAQGLIDNLVVTEADLVWIDSNQHQEIYQLTSKIRILIFNNVNQAKKYFKNKYYKYNFVRANYKEFSEITKELKSEKNIFYAADPEYWPTYWHKNYFNLIFVDEKSQITSGQIKYPQSKIAILDKPINTKIFYPTKENKLYDICYIANFVFWKKHDFLFSVLDKIARGKSIKLICVGKTFGRDSEINIAAWKYHINLELKNSLSATQVAKIINQSKFGVIVSEKDANPRTIGETLACNVPLIINRDLIGGQRLINKDTGILSKPEDFSKKILWMLNNYHKFNPIKYHNKNLLIDQVIKKCFIDNLK